MKEIIFEVREGEVDGGFNAQALGYGIHTQGDDLETLRDMVKDASIAISAIRRKLQK